MGTPLQTFWPAVVIAIAIPEVFSVQSFNEPDSKGDKFWTVKKNYWAPGFDPLGLKPKDPQQWPPGNDCSGWHDRAGVGNWPEAFLEHVKSFSRGLAPTSCTYIAALSKVALIWLRTVLPGLTTPLTQSLVQ